MADSKDKDKAKGKDEAESGKVGESAEGQEGGAPAEGGDELEGKKKKLGKKKLIIIGAAGLLVLLLGGGAAAFFLTQGKEEEGHKQEEHAAAEKTEKPVYYQLGDLLVNLSGEGKHPNYLKIKVSLELADEKDVPTIEAIKPRIIDNFQVYLRELRIDDLRGSAGIYRLREELLMRVTEAAQPIRIKDVLFQEMLVQ
ncbi:MAG: flagellar basal body-associated FliL family protein [Bdellovibrionales bacterium]